MKEVVPGLLGKEDLFKENNYPIQLDNGAVIYNNKSQFENDLLSPKVLKLKIHLSECGNIYQMNHIHSICGKPVTPKYYFKKSCGLKYCTCPHCVAKRYAFFLEKLQETYRFKDIKKFEHWCGGFEKINIKTNSMEEIKKILKLKHKTITNWIKRCNNKTNNLKLVGGLILDLTDDTSKILGIKVINKDYIYFHYHLFLIPCKTADVKMRMAKMHAIKKLLLDKQRIKCPFFLKRFTKKGKEPLKDKDGVFSYMALRKAGLFKSHEFKLFTKDSLANQLQKGKFLLLKDIFTLEEYSKLIHNKKFFFKVDYKDKKYSMPKGSISSYISNSNKSPYQIPKSCPHCKQIIKKGEIVTIIQEVALGDPPFNLETKNIEELLLFKNSINPKPLKVIEKVVPINFNEGIENFTSKSLWEVKQEQNK